MNAGELHRPGRHADLHRVVCRQVLVQWYQVHAANGTLAGLLSPDLGVHGASPFPIFQNLRWFRVVPIVRLAGGIIGSGKPPDEQAQRQHAEGGKEGGAIEFYLIHVLRAF
ncbi:MAG: hypothetical protein IPJ00_02180 [Saprospirales bacterium]|nr:hypothetical protein [Saprospirales bacterium]